MFFPGIMAMMSVQHQSTHNQREHPEGYCGFNTMAAEVKSVCVCVNQPLGKRERAQREARFFSRTARTQQFSLLNCTNESDSIKQFTAFALVHLIKALIGQLSLQRV